MHKEVMFPDLVLHLLYSTPIGYANLLKDFLRYLSSNFFHLLIAPPIDVHEEEEEEEEEDEGVQQKRNGNDADELSDYDMRVVVGRLGMVGWGGGGGEGGGGLGREGVVELLEEKRASLEELREAFYVFDKNEDGFISAGELWCVMRRLGLPEGLRLGDCERMIRAFDEDGDGRISFDEFAHLMENAT